MLVARGEVFSLSFPRARRDAAVGFAARERLTIHRDRRQVLRGRRESEQRRLRRSA